MKTYALRWSVWFKRRHDAAGGDYKSVEAVFSTRAAAYVWSRKYRDTINRVIKREGFEGDIEEIIIKDELTKQWDTAFMVMKLPE